MSMARPLQELRAMTEDKLIAAHDATAKNTVVGLNYYLDELLRREQYRQTQAMIKLTDQTKKLTFAIVVPTVIILAATIA